MKTQAKVVEPTKNGLEQIKAVSMPFDFKNEDTTWSKYGITEVPLNIRAADGKEFEGNYKGIFQNRIFRDIATKNYVVFPNEEVDVVVEQLIKKHGKEYGIYLHESHYAKNKDIKFWELRSDKTSEFQRPIKDSNLIRDSKKVNDVVQVGLVIRNSLAGNVSFGADFFTYRLVCANGAVARGRELAGLKIKHYGKDALKLMVESLEKRLHDLLYEGMELLNHYDRMAKLKMKQEVADMLGKRIATKYLPDYIQVEESKKLAKPKIILTTEGKNQTQWNTFNEITEAMWHNKDVAFNTKAYMTARLHGIFLSQDLMEELK